MVNPRWLNEREAHLWRAWVRLNQGLPNVLEGHLSRDSGLSGADYAVLVPLSEAPAGMMRARELRLEIAWDRSRLSHQVKRMEKRGLVTREECEDDARGAMIRITDTGRTAIEDAAPGHVTATRKYFFDLLSEDDIAALTAIHDRILANLELSN